MKKILCMFLIFAFSSIVFAETINLNKDGTEYGSKIVQLSNNVEAEYRSDGTYFVAITLNPKAGDKTKAYLVTSESGGTFYQDKPNADNITASDIPSKSDLEGLDNGTTTTWKKL